MGIVGYPNKKRYQTGLTSLIPVVLFYTDQRQEKKQIGVWPCLLALLEILIFLFKSVLIKEIHIFIFVIQPQFILLTLGGFFPTGCGFLGFGSGNIKFVKIRIPLFIFFYLIPFIHLLFPFF